MNGMEGALLMSPLPDTRTQCAVIHIEPKNDGSMRLFLMQEGRRMSAASPFLPAPYKDLIQSQRQSSSVERDLVDFLYRTGYSEPIHVHTSKGILEVWWNPSLELGGKTELDIVGSLVRVQRVAVNRSQPTQLIHEFTCLGDVLAVCIQEKTLCRISDQSGWYIANMLEEAEIVQDETGEYDIEYDAGGDSSAYMSQSDEIDINQIQDSKIKSDIEENNFDDISEPFEIPIEVFVGKKIAYPAGMRESYHKDLILKTKNENAILGQKALDARVAITKHTTNDEMAIQVSSYWDEKPFFLGDDLQKYFDYLGFHRFKNLRRKKNKEELWSLCFKLLETEYDLTEQVIAEAIPKLKLAQEESDAAAEYLRRFAKKFIQHCSEQLLISKGQWFSVGLDSKQMGLIHRAIAAYFDVNMIKSMDTGQAIVPAGMFFARLKVFFNHMKKMGVGVYFNQRSIQSTQFKFTVSAPKTSNIQWLDVDPKIEWDGKMVSEADWKWILQRNGVIEQNGNLVILDDSSFEVLMNLRDLMDPGKLKHKNQVQKNSRLQILDWIHLRKFGVNVELSEEQESIVANLLNFSSIKPRDLPTGFRGKLRDYQKEGYDWIGFLYEHQLGGCLADDMGLGKTIQAIAFLGGLKEQRFKQFGVEETKNHIPHLLVVPPTLVFNWKSEFEKFYPDMKISDYTGAGRRLDYSTADVIITSYEVVRKDIEKLEKKTFHSIVYDEAQFIKNIHAKRTMTARRLKGRFSLTLTGTPLENHLGEYYSVLDLSLPGLLGDYNTFAQLESDGNMKRSIRRARPFVMRRSKETILKELPLKQESEIRFEMTKKQKALYQKVVSKVKKTISTAFKEQGAGQANITALTAILRLRQLCVSPRVLDPNIDEVSPKLEYLSQKLEELIIEEHSALVFSQFTSSLDVLEQELQKRGVEYFRMDGSVSQAKRKTMVEAFQCGAGPPIFLISLKTGGVGLNLTRASYVYMLDPWWNPAVENQAADRVHRIGQTKSVFVTRLIMSHSIEEKMMVLKQHKSDLCDKVLEQAGQGIKKSQFSKEDFDYLLS